MCSLVNAKSGGCAEDCGFCAQSRFAEADTPLHAMMSPEQILEHARAAEAAGAHRFCMVPQGQGLSRRDFEKSLDGARLVARHTSLKRCASIGHMSVDRARALREAGIQRVHHNVETAESYYDEVSTTVRYEGRIRTIEAVREAGLETCVGGILNLGETREQRGGRPTLDPPTARRRRTEGTEPARTDGAPNSAAGVGDVGGGGDQGSRRRGAPRRAPEERPAPAVAANKRNSNRLNSGLVR